MSLADVVLGGVLPQIPQIPAPGGGSAIHLYLIGFLVSLASSVANAFGLNLLQRDHLSNASKPVDAQTKEWQRPMWYAGLLLYVGSQAFGNTIALNFLKTQWVAPLGAVALIFNFVFGYFLVGLRVTRRDIIGTVVVVSSVVWIVVFGGMNGDAGDREERLTLEDLKLLFARPVFIGYFVLLNVLIVVLIIATTIVRIIIVSDERKQRDPFFRGVERSRVFKHLGILIAVSGGLLASETLLLAKSGVKLIVLTMNGFNQFTDGVSSVIILLLLVTAVAQIYCLNTGLKMAPSVLVVPVFFGAYTMFGLINGVIYLDQLNDYQPWVLFLVALGCAVLMVGVMLLSEEKPAAHASLKQITHDEDDDLDGTILGSSHSINLHLHEEEVHIGSGHRRRTSKAAVLDIEPIIPLTTRTSTLVSTLARSVHSEHEE